MKYHVKKFMRMKFVLSFHDINPQKKIHALVIPKGKYIDLDDFSQNASPEEMVGLIKGINKVAKNLIYQLTLVKDIEHLANISENGGQEVHIYIFICLVERKLVKWS